MPKLYKYECSVCHKLWETPDDARTNLVVKKIEFRQYGFKGKLIRSRTLKWLCRRCMMRDVEYNLPENYFSDGMQR